ncbi:PfkB family carbohydrate kinase, partial [Lactobacillus nasalidis]
MKSVLISQDLSCVGQVSMSVALPVLGASGLQTAALPTAILSTHTGGFGENTFLDLSASLPEIWEHWHEQQIDFDAIYLGYLGRAASRVWEKGLEECSRQGKLILLDPAMADHGRLYRGFDEDYVRQMQRLARQATILTPNLTEALLLLNEPADFDEIDSHRASVITQRLSQKFALAQVVLTGVPLADNKIGVYGLSRCGQVWERVQDRIPRHYFGTGDLFASSLLAGLLHGADLESAAAAAGQF